MSDYNRSIEKLRAVPDHNQEGADYYLSESFQPYALKAIYVKCGNEANYIDVDAHDFTEDIPHYIEKYDLRSSKLAD